MSQYPAPQTSLRAVEKLMAHPCLERQGRIALLRRYVDLHRQMRKIRVAQWETAQALVEDWHGTPQELIQAARGLA